MTGLVAPDGVMVIVPLELQVDGDEVILIVNCPEAEPTTNSIRKTDRIDFNTATTLLPRAIPQIYPSDDKKHKEFLTANSTKTETKILVEKQTACDLDHLRQQTFIRKFAV
jgi:hypothetical protein